MKILLVNNRYKKNTKLMAEKIAVELNAMNIDAAIDSGKEDPLIKDMDKIIVLGGDGTILRAARRYARWQVPVLGVNMGTVGFLSNIENNEFHEYLQQFIAGDYSLDERMMLEVSIYQANSLQKTVYCLNEVVVRSETSRMVSFNIQVDGQTVGAYRGDGIIIATPTGSTAYSLSSGGPVTDPLLESFVITPIASSVISKRPMVVSADRTLCLAPFECREASICMDGQVKLDFQPDYNIKISKAPYKLKLVDLKRVPFFSTVEERLRRNEGVL